MWRVLALAPEFGTLGHTEAVLFVDNDEPQAGELYRIFDDGMGAHEDVDGAVEQAFEHLLTTLALDDARQQRHSEIHAVEKLHDGLQVLFGEDFRGGHDTGLITVIDGDEHRHQGHEGLA